MYLDWNVRELGFDILWANEASNENPGKTNTGMQWRKYCLSIGTYARDVQSRSAEKAKFHI